MIGFNKVNTKEPIINCVSINKCANSQINYLYKGNLLFCVLNIIQKVLFFWKAQN